MDAVTPEATTVAGGESVDPVTIERIGVGQTYAVEVLISDEMVRHFAAATGDNNPLHLDDEFARRSIFKARVAHGMLSAGILSMVFGTRFPGLGTIYLSQEMRFLRPVFIGDTLRVELEVREVMLAKNRIRVATTCRNQHGQEVLTGEAVVMPPRPPDQAPA